MLLAMLQEDPQDNVEQLCVDMQDFAIEHYITGCLLMLEYDEQVLSYSSFRCTSYDFLYCLTSTLSTILLALFYVSDDLFSSLYEAD